MGNRSVEVWSQIEPEAARMIQSAPVGNRPMRNLKRSLKQFGFFRGVSVYFAKLLLRNIDRYGIVSYSQTGEDRIIDSFFVDHEGFYVEVGSNHPIFFSNTYFLYKKGWRGIAIDPNCELIEKHRKIRRNDIAVCAAVSDKVEKTVFTEFDEPLVSSIDPGHVIEWKEKRSVKRTREITTVTLTSVLDEYSAPSRFDLLCIDVEGHDLQVLSSIDLDRYRPKLIVIEMHKFDIRNPAGSLIYQHLTARGFEMVGYATMNGYFVDRLGEPEKAGNA